MEQKLGEIRINRKKGFSMIELIIVIAVMAILIALIGTQLLPYLERSRATKDYNSLDALFKAYSSVISEADNPGTVTLSDPEVLKYVGMSTLSDFTNTLKSRQLKGTTLVQFCNKDASGQVIKYGICAQGQNGYTGVQMDSSGTKCILGKKGSGTRYMDSDGNEITLAVTTN